MDENISDLKNNFNFTKVFEYCLLALVLLLPIIFVPSVSVSLYSAKIGFLSLIIVVFIGSFLANTLSTGKIVFPKSKILIPVILFPVIALISSVFSGVPLKSIVGEIFEFGTSVSLLIVALLFFVALFGLRHIVSGFKVWYAFFLSSIVVIFHLLLRVVAIYILPASVAARIPNFLVGGPIDTAIFLGATIIATLSILNHDFLTKRMRYVLYAILFLSMIYIGATGFMEVIVLLGIFSLIHFVYSLSWSVNENGSVMRNGIGSSFPSLFVLVLAVIFILSGSDLSRFLSNLLRMNVLEVRPNVSTTFSIIAESWKQNAATGVGANMFKEFWDLKKSIDINNTQFWATEFNFGSGFIPTLAVTTGLLGVLSLLVFLGLLARKGFSSLFASYYENGLQIITSTSFFVAAFLWLTTFIYSGSISIIGLAFVFSGVFVACLVLAQMLSVVEVNIFKNPRVNFVSVFLIVVLLISCVAGGYFVWERIVAATMFNRGSIESALRIAPNDRYWRAFSEKTISEIGNIISNTSSGELTDSQRLTLQRAVSDSITGVQQAINWNPKNFQNWFAMGRVYEILAANGLQGALDNARSNYAEAAARSPLSPTIPLALSRLYALSGDTENARAEIIKAIQLKNNYTDAYFTLAQLEVATKNIPGAIASVEAATLIDPLNSQLFFQLGFLKYNNEDFRGAVTAFEQAVKIVPNYANARYFLGLAYDRLGRTADAISQFEEIKNTNPDNAEVDFILSNLKAGRPAFTNARPPVDPEPEKRPKPPIEEN
jgi:tetratricopeptide (TPR) repeat protein